MRKLVVMIGLMVAGSLVAQDYHYQANIEENKEAGFCQVSLAPEVLGKLNSNYSDLRLIDEKGVEQPYFIDKEEFSVNKRVFKEYKLVEKVKWRGRATVLYVENTDTAMINNIQLQIKNFDVRKRLELAGSDDYQEWYTIKENYVFHSANGINTTSEVKSLNFPYCDYRYYRIIIWDWYHLPVNVLKIGYYDTYQEKGKFNKVDGLHMYVVDSNEVKKTYVKCKFNKNPYFDKLVFKVDKPAYYYRNAQLAIKQKDYKGRYYYQAINHFVLSSNSELTIFENAFPYKEFYLIIDNEDNPPLEGMKVEAYQLKHRLISYLEKDKSYTLVFGSDSLMPTPNYDINFFKDKVGDNTSILKIGEIKPYQAKLEEKEQQSSNQIIWITVALLACLLGFISYRMIMEMEKKK